MEELATYAADSGYLYQAWEKSDVTAKLGGGGFTSIKLRGVAEAVCKHGSYGENWFSDDDYSDDDYSESLSSDGEYDDTPHDDEYDSEER